MKASFIHLSGSKRGETEVFQREWIQIGSHPEISTTQLVIRCSVPPRVAIAMSVFVLAITAAFGAGMHALSAQPVWQVVVWSIPGVLIGSTIGSRVGKYLPCRIMEKGLGIVFAGVGGLVLVLEFLA